MTTPWGDVSEVDSLVVVREGNAFVRCAVRGCQVGTSEPMTVFLPSDNWLRQTSHSAVQVHLLVSVNFYLQQIFFILVINTTT